MATSSKSSKTKSVKLITPPFRVSFPHVFEAARMSDDATSKPKFNLQALWEPGKFTPDEKALWSAIGKEMDRQCLAAFKKRWKDLPANFKKGIRHGSEKDGMEGYGDHIRFATLATAGRPGIVDAKRNPISVAEGNADEIYPGCWCRATVNIYTYDNKGKGIALGLGNLQKVKDGPRLDNRTAAEDDFDDFMDGDSDDDDFGETEADDDFG
jgi:hypothetical protein